jgi:hypothetical protein
MFILDALQGETEGAYIAWWSMVIHQLFSFNYLAAMGASLAPLHELAQDPQ